MAVPTKTQVNPRVAGLKAWREKEKAKKAKKQEIIRQRVANRKAGTTQAKSVVSKPTPAKAAVKTPTKK